MWSNNDKWTDDGEDITSEIHVSQNENVRAIYEHTRDREREEWKHI